MIIIAMMMEKRKQTKKMIMAAASTTIATTTIMIDDDYLTMLKLRCAGGREFNPRPGQYGRMSFSSDQVTGKVFSSEHAFPSKILNLFRTLSSWGSSNYRPSALFLYKVASHVKKTAISAIIIIII